DRGSRSRSDSKNMSQVNLGLGFCYAMFVLFLVAILIRVLAVLWMKVSEKPEGLIALGVIDTLAQLGATVSGLVGSIFCCFMPRKSGIRPLIVVAASLEGSAVLLTLLSVILRLAGSDAALVFFGIALFLSFAGWVLFMIFLSNLARFLNDDPTAGELVHMMIKWMALLVG